MSPIALPRWAKSPPAITALALALVVTPIAHANAMALVHSGLLFMLLAAPGVFLWGMLGLPLGGEAMLLTGLLNFLYYFTMIKITSEIFRP